jgi:hypothetical protein
MFLGLHLANLTEPLTRRSWQPLRKLPRRYNGYQLLWRGRRFSGRAPGFIVFSSPAVGRINPLPASTSVPAGFSLEELNSFFMGIMRSANSFVIRAAPDILTTRSLSSLVITEFICVGRILCRSTSIECRYCSWRRHILKPNKNAWSSARSICHRRSWYCWRRLS